MKPSPRLLKTLINLWPPFLGAGIKVRHIAPDWKQIDVRLRLGLTNRNYVGVHFGGSLYSMTDPFFMLMLMQSLGRDYVVWDKAGAIEYHKPGKGVVSACFTLHETQLHDIRQRTASGDKYLPELKVDIRDETGDIVATVNKTLYVRRKKGR
jgi:acyl-coenzyme A thioesterase PaaI-like protein